MKSISTFLTLLYGSLLPTQVIAHNGVDHTQAEATATAAGIGIFLMLMFLFFALLFIVSFVFWIIMLIHASQNDIPDKNMWVVILVVSLIVGLPMVGSIVYYFVVKKNFPQSKSTQQSKKQRK